MKLQNATHRLLQIATVVALAGCASTQSMLAPAADAHTVRGLQGAASVTVHAVRIIAQAKPWRGDASINQRVTPLRVIIQNRGHVPVRLRYRDFTLVGTNKRVYHALPPHKTSGVVTRRTPPYEPTFAYSGYAIAPPNGYAYPNISVWNGDLASDPYYIANYYPYWGAAILPTRDMIAKALPEGVLKPGGSVIGYLYFQHVDKGVKNIAFVAKLTNVQTGKHDINATIPFAVKTE